MFFSKVVLLHEFAGLTTKKLKFITNIKCGGCVQQVTVPLNDLLGEGLWRVELDNPDNILAIANPNVQETEITQTAMRARFSIVKMHGYDCLGSHHTCCVFGGIQSRF